jgi:hypothetical protein
MIKKTISYLCCFCLISACASPKKVKISAEALVGVTVLSSFQIAAGLLEGIASVPYYLSTDLRAINQGLIKAQAEITLDDTYQLVSSETNLIFKTMKQTTAFFQKLLKKNNIYDHHYYIITAINEISGKYTLFAVIYCTIDRIEVIDWAALSINSIQTKKARAIFFTLAINSILNEKRMPEYWEIQKHWLAGNAYEIVKQRTREMNRRMGIVSNSTLKAIYYANIK